MHCEKIKRTYVHHQRSQADCLREKQQFWLNPISSTLKLKHNYDSNFLALKQKRPRYKLSFKTSKQSPLIHRIYVQELTAGF